MALTDDDLAYMRETQAEFRPTEAELVPRIETPDGMGGSTPSDGEPVPVAVRIAAVPDKVPDAVAAQYGPNVLTVTMDLVPVRSGDTVRVSPTEAYEVVSEGDPGEWTTAQQVLAVRTRWPVR